MNENKAQPTIRVWIAIVLFMFIGSIAGSTQSMYLGLFLDNTLYENGPMGASITLTDTINLIVSLGAVVLCITAFIMGTLSEKLKNRKVFISAGYILWGIVMLFFSAVSKENVAKLFGFNDVAKSITVTAMIVISFALVLAFLRSTTNDTVFSAWLTEVSTPKISAIIEVLFTLMGFVATGVITLLVVGVGKDYSTDIEIFDKTYELDLDFTLTYSSIFIILGMAAIIIGILGFFIIHNPKKVEETEKKTGEKVNIFYGLKPSVIKENSNLYLMLMSGCLFNCAYQVFYPYFFIYISSVIIPKNKEFEVPVFILLALMSVSLGFMLVLVLMKAYSKHKALSFIPSVICLIVGFLILSSTTNIFGFVVGLAPAFVGYVIIMIQFGATVRDNIPQDKAGLFQGVRMIFLFLIPMIVGPTIGNIAAKNSNVTYMDNYAEKLLPTEDMFLYAAIFSALIFIPMIPFLIKDSKKARSENNE